ncbi:DUF202 domain-containing protein [Actinomycetospora aeridis]|uniref:DUF202 domain-containing protein n=1 Tax=Actinomycetospora aeridis TaxID=3129231 RepID=A0ABU8N132_9PSEU
MSTSPSDAGLQAERTGLAWSRTSLGVAANAVLLAVRELTHDGPGPSLVLAGSAAALAVVVAVYGRRRSARINRSPLPVPLAAGRAVPLLGAAVTALALITGVVLALR